MESNTGLPTNKYQDCADIPSVAEYLNRIIEIKKKANPRLSIRGIAQRMGLSPAMLSCVLNCSKHLSMASAFKVSQGLKLKGFEHDYFLDVVLYETVGLPQTKIQLGEKIRSKYLYTNKTKTKVISDILKQTSISKQYVYGIPGTHKTRSLSLLIETGSGIASSHFYDCFIDTALPFSSTGFFIYNDEGFYEAYMDNINTKKLQIFQWYSQNNHLFVAWDNKGFPTVQNLILRTNENCCRLADLIFNEEASIIRGENIYFDEAQRTEPCEIIYNRL